ncbi:MAG: PmoA family protein [Dehalococcoidales bacterium]|nr:PmoA family protein [Dehalococcoidales bacterium]
MRTIYLLLILFLFQPISSQEIARFTLHQDKSYLNTPVSITLDNTSQYNFSDKKIVLYEIFNNKEVHVPSQLETGKRPILWFIPNHVSGGKIARNFVVKLTDTDRSEKAQGQFQMKKSGGDLTIYKDTQPVLSYRYRTMYPPEGVDPLYERSGFIHPLYSPKGEVLTRVQAPDHYHHYGIWGPWTLTHIDDREVDFWNLAKGQGTVKFNSFLSEVSGDVYSGFKVLQQHIDFGNKGEDQIAINEVLEVRVWNVDEKVWIVDYTTTLNSPLPNGIVFDAYRYGGGIGFRATEKWEKDNSTVLTSEGKTRVDADGSRARWCIVEGETDVEDKRSGILFMSHPFNQQHPEPMRVWPMDANGGRGDIYFEFVPIRHEPWIIKPHRDYTLSYRMVVFDGELDKDTAEAYWNSFANTPKADMK